MDLVKITMPVPKENLLQADTESIWAEPQPDGTYRIDSVPFLAKGISSSDIVEADSLDGTLVYRKVLRHSGHSTYRIYAQGGWNSPDVLPLIEALEKMDCDIEPATEKLVAVDVPPEANVYEVYAALNEAERSGKIDFEEGHCGHPLREKSS
jgi:Domain of unknown function (DUF4265)